MSLGPTQRCGTAPRVPSKGERSLFGEGCNHYSERAVVGIATAPCFLSESERSLFGKGDTVSCETPSCSVKKGGLTHQKGGCVGLRSPEHVPSSAHVMLHSGPASPTLRSSASHPHTSLNHSKTKIDRHSAGCFTWHGWGASVLRQRVVRERIPGPSFPQHLTGGLSTWSGWSCNQLTL